MACKCLKKLSDSVTILSMVQDRDTKIAEQKIQSAMKEFKYSEALTSIILKVIFKETINIESTTKLIDVITFFIVSYRKAKSFHAYFDWFIDLKKFLTLYLNYPDIYANIVIHYLHSESIITHHCPSWNAERKELPTDMNIEEVLQIIRTKFIPEDLSRVEKTNLFICEFETAQMALSYRFSLPIHTIINVSNEDHTAITKQFWSDHKINYHYFYLQDNYFQYIMDTAEKIYQIIENNPEKNIIVHCHAGISRSVACVMFYLMKKYGFERDQALRSIRKTRDFAKPNGNFIIQLDNWLWNQRWKDFKSSLSKWCCCCLSRSKPKKTDDSEYISMVNKN